MDIYLKLNVKNRIRLNFAKVVHYICLQKINANNKL